MYEHGEPSKGFPMVDLSSEEEEATSDTSWEEEITHKLFGDLNHDLLRPLGDDNVIIISDSKEEEDVREDDDVDAEVAPSSTWNSLAPSTSAADTDDAPNGVQDDSSDGGAGADMP
jgi:hypothetical protein